MGPTNFLPHFLPPSLDRILVKYQQWAFARLQCDRIRRLFKVLVHNFLFNGSPNIRWMFDQFWKSNILSKAAVVATLCKQLLEFLGYFLFQHLVTLLAFSADSFNTRWEYFVGRLLSSPSLGAQIIHICVDSTREAMRLLNLILRFIMSQCQWISKVLRKEYLANLMNDKL